MLATRRALVAFAHCVALARACRCRVTCAPPLVFDDTSGACVHQPTAACAPGATTSACWAMVVANPLNRIRITSAYPEPEALFVVKFSDSTPYLGQTYHFMKWSWAQPFWQIIDAAPYKLPGNFIDFDLDNAYAQLRPTAYRVRSSLAAPDGGGMLANRQYSRTVWATNYDPATPLNLEWVVGPVWNSAFQVVETIEDWTGGPTVSIEEVAFGGGNVVPFWTQKNTVVNSQKNIKEREHIRKARQLASPAGVPLRFFLELRFDVYGEYGDEKAAGFDDAWLLTASKQATCATLEEVGLANVSFDTAQDLAFWQRLWPGVTSAYALPAGACDDVGADEVVPIFYAQRAADGAFVIKNALADVANADYREWHVQQSKAFMQFFRDAEDAQAPDHDDIVPFVVLKTGWEVHSTARFDEDLYADQPWSCPTYLPPLVSDCVTYGLALPNPNKCPLTACAPYAPGVFEASVRAWMHRFHEEVDDVPIATNENPATQQKLAWVGDDASLRAFVMGDLLFAGHGSPTWCALYPATGACA